MSAKKLIILERIILAIVCITLFSQLFILRSYSIAPPADEIALSLINIDISDIIISYLMMFAFIIFLIKLLFSKEAPTRTSLDLFFILFVVITGVSISYSVDKYLTLKEWLLLCTNIAAFYLLVNYINSRVRFKFFISFFISLGFCVSLLGLFQYFFVYSFLPKDLASYNLTKSTEHMINLKRIVSVFGWPNYLSGYLAMVLPLSSAYIFILQSRWQRYVMVLITLIIFLAMLFTYTISAWLGLVIAILITFWFYVMPKGSGSARGLKITKIFPSILVIILVSAVLLVIAKRATPFTIASFNSRIEYVRSALLMIKNHPIFGTGLGTFGVVIPNYINTPAAFSRYAHNSYLQIFAESGILGILLFLLIIFFIVKESNEAVKNPKEQKEYLFSLGLFCAILAFLLDNLYNFTMLIPKVSLSWWVLVAIIFARPKKVYTPSLQLEKPTQKILIVFWLIIASLSVICLVHLNLGNIYLANGIKSLGEGNTDKALNYLNKAKYVNPFDGRPYSISGRIYLMLYTQHKDQMYLKEAKSVLKEAARRSPTIAYNYAFLADILQYEGDIKEAKRNYVIASKLAPYMKRYKELASKDYE